MLAYLMFKTKALLDDLEDFVSAELLRILQLDATEFAAAGMTLDFDTASARFTIASCAPGFAVPDMNVRKAVWALGFESFILKYKHGKLEYTAAADRGTEPQPPRAAGAAAGS